MREVVWMLKLIDIQGCKQRFACSEMNKCVRVDEEAVVEVCYEEEIFCPA